MADRLQPAFLFDMIARVLPGELKPRILVVGSLAAAYRFRDQIHHDGITTKDADCALRAGRRADPRVVRRGPRAGHHDAPAGRRDPRRERA